MDRDLKLNSIDRYTKSSPRFVLEEHGHCEVPAGCGGVVLRWRDPNTAVPVRLQLLIVNAVEYSTLVDGTRLASSRPLLSPGEHVLTISATAGPDATVQLLFSAYADLSGDQRLLISEPSASWSWTTEEPPDEWTRLDYDDVAWSPMTPGRLTAEQADEYVARRLLESGATPLTTPARSGRLWIRATFQVPAER
jgi:hypothetical protein